MSSSKKESLASTLGAGAGELANFFDKLKKKSSTPPSTPQPAPVQTTQTEPAQPPPPPASSGSLLSNLAINIGKRVLSDQKIASLNTSKTNLTLAKLLNDESNNNNNNNNDEYDDQINSSGNTKTPVEGSPTKVSTSQSDYELNKPVAATRTNRNSITSSSSMTDSLNKAATTVPPSSEDLKTDATSTGEHSNHHNSAHAITARIPASTSLQRISSVFDDVVESAHNEAEQLRRRIFTKKKSIESSLENMKHRMNSSHSISHSLSNPTELSHTPPPPFQVVDEVFADPFEPSPTPTPTQLHIEQITTTIPERAVARSSLSGTSKQREQKKKVQLINESNRNVLIAILIAVFAFFAFMPKSFSLVFIFYMVGLLSGVAATGILFYFAIKHDVVKYFLKTESSAVSDAADAVATDEVKGAEGEKEVVEEIHSFLLQTAVRKENKNFDGVYKVNI
jgi:hypothetical protein